MSTETAPRGLARLVWPGVPHAPAVVVKLGGSALAGEAVRQTFARDVVALRHAGFSPVVVHGGGPQIDAHLDRLGLAATFTAGLRVTTEQMMAEVRMVLAGQVQRDLVGLLNRHGPLAVGLTGEDARIMTAVRRPAVVDGRPVDIGLVGEVTEVDTGLLRTLLADGRIPVVSSIARGAGGGVYNVNADTAAAALAGALGAVALVLMTDVEGLYLDWPTRSRLVDRLTAEEAEELLPEIDGSMVPKLEACVRAVRAGVTQAHIIDGRSSHALLRLLHAGVGGTTVSRSPGQPGPPAAPRWR
ncbi:acetylglutamate kinase [Kitasatospora sp. NPDC052896]|uniref:acetylglutamate kinase n=1 Tax=Kitasatospora sp. NPDC052896 TaxID=3364061 RepID=UPI0037CA8649